MCLPRGTTSRTVAPVRSRAASCGSRNSPRRSVAPASAVFIRWAASQTVSPSGTPPVSPRVGVRRRSAACDVRRPWQHPGSDRGRTARAGGGAGLRRAPWPAATAARRRSGATELGGLDRGARRRPAAAAREAWAPAGSGLRPRERGGAAALGRPVHAGPGRPGARRATTTASGCSPPGCPGAAPSTRGGWPIPAPAVDAIGAGLRALHDALPVAGCPFDWSAGARVAEARLELHAAGAVLAGARRADRARGAGPAGRRPGRGPCWWSATATPARRTRWSRMTAAGRRTSTVGALRRGRPLGRPRGGDLEHRLDYGSGWERRLLAPTASRRSRPAGYYRLLWDAAP